jgi:hypothetical protein
VSNGLVSGRPPRARGSPGARVGVSLEATTGTGPQRLRERMPWSRRPLWSSLSFAGTDHTDAIPAAASGVSSEQAMARRGPTARRPAEGASSSTAPAPVPRPSSGLVVTGKLGRRVALREARHDSGRENGAPDPIPMVGTALEGSAGGVGAHVAVPTAAADPRPLHASLVSAILGTPDGLLFFDDELCILLLVLTSLLSMQGHIVSLLSYPSCSHTDTPRRRPP